MSEELRDKLDRLKDLFSHLKPGMSDAQLVEIMADKLLQKVDPLKKSERNKRSLSPEKVAGQKSAESTMTKAIPAKTKAIPSKVKTRVWQRDEGQCTYITSSGKRCTSQHLLQIDHIRPRAFDGGHNADNLRLLCHAHHQMRTKEVFSLKRSIKIQKTRSQA